MPTRTIDDPILNRFCAAVDQAYGDRIERIVLYGSRARGDHRPDSDYDVAVFIRDCGSLFEELHCLAEITANIAAETEADISAKPFPADAYQARTGFMHELRRDGIDI